MNRLPAILALTGLLLATLPVAAGTLYRCIGKQGEVAYTNSQVGYSQCSAMRSYSEDTPRPPAGAAVGATTSQPAASTARVEFRTAPGTATPTAPTGNGPAKTTTGAVYKYVKDGVTHYTNRRPSGQKAQVLFSYIESCFACGGGRSSADFHTVALNTKAFALEVASMATEYGVDPALVRAVIHAESAFDPNALSNKGAQGLMQLIPATAERFGVTDAFSAAENIRGGTRYLAWLLKRFDGDMRLAAAGYNAGEGAVDRFGGVPPYRETQNYVERVEILHGRYRTALAAAPAAVTSGAVAAP